MIFIKGIDNEIAENKQQIEQVRRRIKDIIDGLSDLNKKSEIKLRINTEELNEK